MHDVVHHGSVLSNSGFCHHLGMRCPGTLAQFDKTNVLPIVSIYQISLCVYMLLLCVVYVIALSTTNYALRTCAILNIRRFSRTVEIPLRRQQTLLQQSGVGGALVRKQKACTNTERFKYIKQNIPCSRMQKAIASP